MCQNLSLQSTIREISFDFQYDELAGINLQHNDWKNLDIKIEEWFTIPNFTIIRIIA